MKNFKKMKNREILEFEVKIFEEVNFGVRLKFVVR